MLRFSNPLHYIHSYNITELDELIVFPDVNCVILESYVTPHCRWSQHYIPSQWHNETNLVPSNVQSSNDSLKSGALPMPSST